MWVKLKMSDGAKSGLWGYSFMISDLDSFLLTRRRIEYVPTPTALQLEMFPQLMSILKSFLCPYKSSAPGFLLLVVELCWGRKVREVWDQLSWSWVSFLHRHIVWEHQNRNHVGRWATGALTPGSKLDPPSKNAWTKSWLHLGSGLNGSWNLIADYECMVLSHLWWWFLFSLIVNICSYP